MSSKPRGDEASAWLLSRLLFFWMGPLFKHANQLAKEKQSLEQYDLPLLPDFDKGRSVSAVFNERWDETKNIWKSLYSVLGWRFIVAGGIKVVNSGLQFAFPLILNAILKFIEDRVSNKITDEDRWQVRYRGYWLSVVFFCFLAAKAVTESAYFFRINRCAYQARVAVSVAVYNKSLKLANSERQSTTLGELVNLMQVDATKVEMLVPQMHVLWDGLLQITGYMAILYSLIGWPCFVGLAVMVVTAPIQGVVVQKLFGLNRSMVQYTDERVRRTNEALQGIQSVKMFAWETNFAKMINQSRQQELSTLRRIAYVRGFFRAFISALPGLVAATSFVVYALVSTKITASKLFSALVAFDQLRFPLLFYPMAFANLAQASVSAARLQKFLERNEVNDQKIGSGTYERNETATDGKVVLENVTVYWSDPNIPLDDSTVHSKKSDASDDEEDANSVRYPKPVLKDVSFSVEPGKLCAVVGRVASGKSTLASAILGEALLESGTIRLDGRTAYAAQNPWILNASLRDNILFGQPYDPWRYEKVIDVCQLRHDLSMLDNGDMTEIGEKEINLSGGQKQRVSIARAAYSNADTIIFDDPLSALDPEVGQKLFSACIDEYLGAKTRILITNQLQFLKFCDTVVALRRGKVIEQGNFEDLAENKDGEVYRLLQEGSIDGSKGTAKESAKDTVAASVSPAVAKTQDDNAGALVTKEERAVGAVPLSVYLKYISAGGGALKFFFVYLAFVVSTANGTAIVSWISVWTSDAPEYGTRPQYFYLAIYAMLAVTLGLTSYVSTFMLVRFGVVAAETLHSKLIDSVLRAPQSFFDTTPVGRILSRFSKDLYTIDIELTDSLDFTIYFSLQIVFALATIIYATPFFAIAIVPLLFVYFRALNYFRNVSRETKRLESVSRSPVYALFSETLGGLSTIRAYHLSTQFMTDFQGKVDENTRASYASKAADRWIGVRLETIGALIAGLAAAFATNAAISHAEKGSDSNFASIAGLSLTFAISITGMLNFGVRIFAQLEAAMNACERVLFYTEHIPQEAGWTTDEISKIDRKSADVTNPSTIALSSNDWKPEAFSDDWPAKGNLKFKDLRMRYRDDTPFVLKGLTATIAPGERVGVVGRTGSGKSSLLLTLLRIVEPTLIDKPSLYEPPISIDDVDILRIGLHDLRSRVGIIPQNPVLFSGTIRSNLDPFSKYSDDELWQALANCDLKTAVDEMGNGLEAVVSEYGENLSAGMRQMLVIARALLRKCRIILLDEATSNVDFETDKAIQKTLRKSFPGCTVLTIAHRVNTIMDSDKIMVLKDGNIEEFGPPNQLLADPNSAFSEIVSHAETGVVE